MVTVGKDYVACSAARKLEPAPTASPTNAATWKRLSSHCCRTG
ncbi:hypothetical protein [Citreimonas sp.]